MTAPDPASLPPLEFSARIPRLVKAMTESDIDALVVTKPANLRYLFGFSGSAGVGLVGGEGPMLVTDSRYRLAARAELDDAGVSARLEITRETTQALADAIQGATRVALEADDVSWAKARQMTKAFAVSAPGLEVVPSSGLVENLRERKDAGEVARIGAAAAIADGALASVLPLLSKRVTEVELARALDAAMVAAGATGPAYDTIVATGPNGANPHARPGRRTIEPGHLVVIDVGALFLGYRSDMTRTFSIGQPSPQSRRMLEVVTHAQAEGVASVRSGSPAKDIDAVCRQVIDQAGWADAFEHGTGHGVGLEIHEAPALNARSSDELVSSQVLTVEPGVYFADVGGVRVEDTVVVTDDGARSLTRSPKDPVIA